MSLRACENLYKAIYKFSKILIASTVEYLCVVLLSFTCVSEYLIQNGHMSEDDAKKKFCQIVKAVDYCHKHNIVHRDLKVLNTDLCTCHSHTVGWKSAQRFYNIHVCMEGKFANELSMAQIYL